MTFRLRSLNPETGAELAAEEIPDEQGAWAAFRAAEEHAAEHGGAFELQRDGRQLIACSFPKAEAKR